MPPGEICTGPISNKNRRKVQATRFSWWQLGGHFLSGFLELYNDNGDSIQMTTESLEAHCLFSAGG